MAHFSALMIDSVINSHLHSFTKFWFEVLLVEMRTMFQTKRDRKATRAHNNANFLTDGDGNVVKRFQLGYPTFLVQSVSTFRGLNVF